MMSHEVENLDHRGLRNFAFTFGAVVVALFGLLVPWVFALRFPLWPWCLWTVLAIWGVVAPLSLQPFYRAWMKFGLVMGKITTPLVMATVYYLVITPTGLIARIFRKDPLRREVTEAGETFREDSTVRKREHMENPF